MTYEGAKQAARPVIIVAASIAIAAMIGALILAAVLWRVMS